MRCQLGRGIASARSFCLLTTVAALFTLTGLPRTATAQVWTTFLPGTSVNGIAAGDSGTVLLATTRGPMRYDGLGFARLPIASPDGDSLSALAILQSRTGDIWVATADHGLFQLRLDGTVVRHTESSGLGNSSTDR